MVPSRYVSGRAPGSAWSTTFGWVPSRICSRWLRPGSFLLRSETDPCETSPADVPSGRTHRRIAWSILVAAGGAYVFLRSRLNEFVSGDAPFELAVLVALGFVGGTVLLPPDLDLRRNDALRNWGLLGILWRPYAAVFRHRGLSPHPNYRHCHPGSLSGSGGCCTRSACPARARCGNRPVLRGVDDPTSASVAGGLGSRRLGPYPDGLSVRKLS